MDREHPLTKNVLLMMANTSLYDDKFEWTEAKSLMNDEFDRNKASQNLIQYVINNSNGINEIILIGHSHGGNVALQSVNSLVSNGKKVSVITISTPANNASEISGDRCGSTGKSIIGSTCREEHKAVVLKGNGETIDQVLYFYKNPENPKNCNLSKHIHLWNAKDGVAGGLAGDDFYSSNGITENVEIPTEGEYSGFIKYLISEEYKNAHSFDTNRPQLIYQMLINHQINPL